MNEVYKRLGAIAPADDKEYLLYTAPDGTQSLVSNITVANRSSSSASFDINIYESGVTQQSDLDDVGLPPTYVAISNNSSALATSSDGINWTSSSTLISMPGLSTRVFGEDKFVFIRLGSPATAIYSTDGISWTATTLNPWDNVYYFDAIYANGTYMAVCGPAYGGSTSTDGITWTIMTISDDRYQSIAYGSGIFVATTYQYSSKYAYSTDSVTWTTNSLPILNRYWSVEYGNGVFCAVSGGTYLYPQVESIETFVSTDAVAWTQGTLPQAGYFGNPAYGNGIFFTINGQNPGAISTDGISWTATTLPLNNYWKSPLYANGEFISVSGNIFISSTDAITWTVNTLPISAVNVLYGENLQPYSSPSLNNLYKTSLIDANETQILEPGIALSASASIVAKDNSGGNLTFSTYGVELS